MRAAAPVDAPFARGRVERVVCALLYASAAAGACAAVLPAMMAWPMAALAGAALGAIIWRPLDGSLRWDGRSWSIVDGKRSTRPLTKVRRAIDFGGWLLLRLSESPAGRSRWASLSARDAGSEWHDLRVALIAHGSGAAPAEGAP